MNWLTDLAHHVRPGRARIATGSALLVGLLHTATLAQGPNSHKAPGGPHSQKAAGGASHQKAPGGPGNQKVPSGPVDQKSPLTGDSPLPGMPPLLDLHDVYAAARPGQMSAAVRGDVARVYVPNSVAGTVDVIDPATYKIVDHFKVGREPQHVTPSYDLKSLWVLADKGDSLTRIDPVTGHREQTVAVADPYNMYYTPDGRYAIVVAERKKRLDFHDPHTMVLVKQVSVPCRGVDHMDFSANGRYLVASCEFSGELVKVDVLEEKLLGTLKLPGHSMPQDVRLSPDGSVFFVADMASNGVYVIDVDALQVLTFLPTGRGTHGLYFSRDSRWLYASNRGEGTISVIDVRTRTVARVWHIPRGSPD